VGLAVCIDVGFDEPVGNGFGRAVSNTSEVGTIEIGSPVGGTVGFNVRVGGEFGLIVDTVGLESSLLVLSEDGVRVVAG